MVSVGEAPAATTSRTGRGVDSVPVSGSLCCHRRRIARNLVGAVVILVHLGLLCWNHNSLWLFSDDSEETGTAVAGVTTIPTTTTSRSTSTAGNATSVLSPLALASSTTFYWRYRRKDSSIIEDNNKREANHRNDRTNASTKDSDKTNGNVNNSNKNKNKDFYHHDFEIPVDYDWQRSTEDNYRDPCELRDEHGHEHEHEHEHGYDPNGRESYFEKKRTSLFSESRSRLDPSYHALYVPERETLQDSILLSMLRQQKQQQPLPITAATSKTTNSVLYDADADAIVGMNTNAKRNAIANRNASTSTSTSPVGGRIRSLSQLSSSRDDCETKRKHQFVDQGPVVGNHAWEGGDGAEDELEHDKPRHGEQKMDKKNPPYTNPKKPRQWIVFTAGVYGAGKSYTVRRLQSEHCFPRSHEFVWVDPDAIRKQLPEFGNYGSGSSGHYTQKEAGMVAELLTDAALSSGRNVLVDGSLKDASWQRSYWERLGDRFPGLVIGMVYVTAPRHELTERILARERATGRGIPRSELEDSLRRVPEAVSRLKPSADFWVHVHNRNENDKISSRDPGLSRQSLDDNIEEEDHGSDPLDTRSHVEKLLRSERCRSILGHAED